MPWVLAAIALSLASAVVTLSCGAHDGAMFTAGSVAGAVIYAPAAMARTRQVIREVLTGQRSA